MYLPIAFGTNNQFAGDRTVLAGDVGATKTNLALFSFTGKTYSIRSEKKYATGDFHNIETMIGDLLAGAAVPHCICLGVAGPIQQDAVTITNIPWSIDASAVAQQFSVPVHLINDLEATAYGLGALEEKDVHSVYEGMQQAKGNIALIAPGTGLGEAGLYWDGCSYHPFATEGGHSDFAPRTDLDIELYKYLHKKFGHVSWERVVSGQGIVNIYQFLTIQQDRDVPAWLAQKMLAHDPAAVISEYATEAPVCAETMQLFFRYLATESASLALKFKATGGLFIGGGILPKDLRLLDALNFLRWFRDAGRLKPLLKDIPVKVVLNDRTALLGAAYYGAAM